MDDNDCCDDDDDEDDKGMDTNDGDWFGFVVFVSIEGDGVLLGVVVVVLVVVESDEIRTCSIVKSGACQG